MNTKKFRYDDPTGGGDDIILEIPEMWVPHFEIMAEDQEGYVYSFKLGDEVDDADAN